MESGKGAGSHLEEILRRQGYLRVAGTDEVGRGPLAGPVVASAVMLPEGCTIEGVADSKLLSDEQRRSVLPEILKCALAYGLGSVDAAEIDRINILQASFEAMRLALAHIDCDAVIVDGRHAIPRLDLFQLAQPKADRHSISVAAASIVAKVTRDDVMLDFDRLYPGYGFALHKGYATPQHFDALERLGPSPIHRESFLHKWRERKLQGVLEL
jgi:ribonuclease HII